MLSKEGRGWGHSLEGVDGRAGELESSRVLREGRWLGGPPGSRLATDGTAEPIPQLERRFQEERERVSCWLIFIKVLSPNDRLRRAKSRDADEGGKVVSTSFWFSFLF